MVSWFLEQFGDAERRQSAERGVSPETVLDELLAQTEPGAEGLLLQPFWNPVLGETGPEGRGSIIGFKDFHTRAHVYRALIEGLAFALRSGKERIERRTKTPISCIRLSGGGAQSDQVAQIVADVLNLPVERFDDCEASGRGAAMVGAAAVGWYSSIAAAGEAMAGETHRTTPNPDVTERYQALYKGQYRPLYGRLKSLFERQLTAQVAPNRSSLIDQCWESHCTQRSPRASHGYRLSCNAQKQMDAPGHDALSLSISCHFECLSSGVRWSLNECER
jgi:sugar (pentulose or hexulose) kinase